MVRHPPERWYVIHAEQYIQFFEHKLREHTLSDLESFLNELGGNTALKDWQIRQAADAIRILLCDLADHDWACSFDWDGWVSALERLPKDHPTVARDYDSESRGIDDSFEVTPKAKEPLTEYHQVLIAELVRVLRRKDYAIGTEQSYCHWVGRFFRFLESMQLECRTIALEMYTVKIHQRVWIRPLIIEEFDFISAKQ